MIFLSLTSGGPAVVGWGIPIATDIAFALGVLALLGDRVPLGAKLFLLTIAIVDDIIAISVIAFAYSDAISLAWLAAAVVVSIGVIGLRAVGVTRIWPYVPVGIALWVATFQSGVHATVAGVVLGLLTPARAVGGRDVLRQLEHYLHPVSAFMVVPLFALANAGVAVERDALSAPGAARLAGAIAIALVVGKMFGVAGAALLASRLRLGVLPQGVSTRYVWGLGALAGIGFTVSLFVADLAYDDVALTETAKIGILGGSVCAAVLGSLILLPGRHPRPDDNGATAAHGS